MNYLMRRHMMMKKEGYKDERGNYEERDYRRDYRGDYRYDYRNDYRGGDYRSNYYDSRDYNSREYEERYYPHMMKQDYAMGRDYHSEEQLMRMYNEDLKGWIQKLKEKERFKLPKEEVIKKARSMGMSMKDYTEDELYATYLLMTNLFSSIANEPHTYISMAKSILEDPKAKISPSEKVQIMMYEIAMGGKPYLE